MLLEQLDTNLPIHTIQLLFGLALGLVFGAAAQISRFCLRRSVAGDSGLDLGASAVWLSALAASLIGYQTAAFFGLVDLADHRFLSSNIPVPAVIAGGLMFGVGMVLTRGCISRLTVLGASGNLRGLLVILTFAVVAHATLKGVLSPLRTTLGAITVEAPIASFGDLPGGAIVICGVVFAAAIWLVRISRVRLFHAVLGALIGLVAVAGWAGTSTLLLDEFDPLPAQSAAFTLPWSDTLFWTIASTSIPAGFGTGLVGGVLLGAFASAALRRELQLVSFEDGPQTLRYMLGAGLMGIGGVLAGGCTVGAGLSGTATLSLSAFLALLSIIAGGVVASRSLRSASARPALA